jgi:predicted GTPase
MVVLEGAILNKPEDRDEARRMLRSLSGRAHTVVTSLALLRVGGEALVDAVEPAVTFNELSEELIEAYLLGRKSLALSILLLDVRRGWMEKDLELRQWLEFHNRRYLVVATKTDKLRNRPELHRGLEAIRQVAGHDPVPFSAVTGEGVREIWQAIWKTQNKP